MALSTQKSLSAKTSHVAAPTPTGKARIEVVPLARHIGAEVRGIDLRLKPDEETVRAIYQAWLDHLVLIFPDQKLEQEDLIRATGFFGQIGTLSRPPKYFPKGYSKLLPGIMMISNIRENGEPIGALPDGAYVALHRSALPVSALTYSFVAPTTRTKGAAVQ